MHSPSPLTAIEMSRQRHVRILLPITVGWKQASDNHGIGKRVP